VSKLYCAKKRGYDNHPLASEEWFVKKLKEEHTLISKPRVPLYQLEKERAIAYLDYKWLGRKVEGAPDGTDEEDLLSTALVQHPARDPIRPGLLYLVVP
jgi:hypothetical protein